MLFSGGGYAAGKSSVLKINRARGGEPDSGYEGPALTLDPDQIKARAARVPGDARKRPRGEHARVRGGVGDQQEIQARAQEKKLNMVVDGISNTIPTR